VDGCFPQRKARHAFTIRLDPDIVDRVLEMAEQPGGATGYQTLINAALLRRITREELTSKGA
jgi:uncharacterized protein (DUF4415 family)